MIFDLQSKGFKHVSKCRNYSQSRWCRFREIKFYVIDCLSNAELLCGELEELGKVVDDGEQGDRNDKRSR